MIHHAPRLLSTLCFHDLSIQRRLRFTTARRLLLTQSCRTLVLELLVECVTVTDGGDVVALDSKFSRSQKFGMASAVVSPSLHVPYHQP